MDLISMDEKEPFMFQFQEISLMGDEFMVVPSLLENESTIIQNVQAPQSLVDEFLLEANFAGVTGTILSPPSDHFNSVDFCTSSNGDGHRLDGGTIRQNATVFIQNSNLQQESKDFFVDESNFTTFTEGAAAAAAAAPAPVIGNTACATANYFDDNFDFDGGATQIQNQVQTQVIWEGQVDGGFESEQKQFNELEDPGSTWLSENTDLAYIEKMATENEQQSQLLDELLRSDDLFQISEDVGDSNASEESGEMDVDDVANQILNEIYQEAQQLHQFTPKQDVMDWNEQQIRLSNSTQRQEPGVAPILPATISKHIAPKQVAVAPKIQKQSIVVGYPRHHLTDHDFGAARRGRPPGSTSKRRLIPKRELKVKKRDQNREAALRYRLKKRAEKVEKDSELEQMEQRNQHLKNEKTSLTAEVKYLKELLIEIRKLKGYE